MRRTVILEVIARGIAALEASFKTYKNAVVISDIFTRKAKYKDKARDANEYLKRL